MTGRLILGGPLHRKRWGGDADYFETAEIELSLALGWSPLLTPELPIIKVPYKLQRFYVAEEVWPVFVPADWDLYDGDEALREYLRDAMAGRLREQEVL